MAAETAQAIADEARREARQRAQFAYDAATDVELQTRLPFEASERQIQILSAEAKALADLLRPQEADLWPPLIDSVRVEPGYEAAFAAALGDDL